MRLWKYYRSHSIPTKHDPDSIELSSVQISKAGIYAVDGGRIIVGIPREHIFKVKLAYGVSIERPITQLCGSLTLIGLGVFCGIMAFYCAEGGSIPGISLFGFSATTAILAGASLLIEVFQRKYYLMVNSNKGIRKIAFEKSTALAEIEAFIGKAHDQFGYEIGRQDLNESGFSPGQI